MKVLQVAYNNALDSLLEVDEEGLSLSSCSRITSFSLPLSFSSLSLSLSLFCLLSISASLLSYSLCYSLSLSPGATSDSSLAKTVIVPPGYITPFPITVDMLPIVISEGSFRVNTALSALFTIFVPVLTLIPGIIFYSLGCPSPFPFLCFSSYSFQLYIMAEYTTIPITLLPYS